MSGKPEAERVGLEGRSAVTVADHAPGRGAVGDLPAAAGDPLLDLLNGFIAELRAVGIPASLTENLDAMEAVKHVPIEDRDTFKYALAATLVKNQAHWKAFETVFEVYFSLRGAQFEIAASDLEDIEDADGEIAAEGNGGSSGDMLSPEELAEMLYRALLRGDSEILRAAARQAVPPLRGGWSRAVPWEAPITCTARFATSTSRACSSA